MNKATFIIVAFIIAVAATMLWIAFQPPPGPPNVSIAFLGYTNSATGTPLARFALTNAGASAVRRYPFTIERSTGAGLTNEPAASQQAALSNLPGLLPAGASETFAVPSPANDLSWRMSLLVYPDAGRAQVVKWTVTVALMRAGLKPRYRVMRYEIFSNWIQGEHSQ